MNTEMDLMQRLAVSKKIMDKHQEIKRGDVMPTTPMVENFDTPQATYNLPSEFLSEQKTSSSSNYDPTKPVDKERIMNSKLPDEIKRLMIEQPIVQPNVMGGSSIPDEIIEGAQRLMKINKTSDTTQRTPNSEKTPINTSNTSSNININEIKNMIRDVVRDTVRDVVKEELKEAGMIVESTTNSNETIQFKVGNTVFVGKVTKIKQMQK